MKITVKESTYEKVIGRRIAKHKKPVKPALFWRWLIKFVSKGELKKVDFSCKQIGMEKLGKNQPCLILMNHSCFLDLQIAETVFYPRPLNIVCTSDGFVGKAGLMRAIGCIPTNKFVPDFVMVKDVKYALEKLKSSVLMFPEASYSFDGTATDLPDTLGKFLKLIKVPVVMVKTDGAFARNPLYNNLQIRNVKVSATVKYLLSTEEIAEKSADELNSILKNEFTFDNWKWQQENNILITENFRADCLNRVLYKCCCCQNEGLMVGKGINLECKNCGAVWELTTKGFLQQVKEGSVLNKLKFNHVPDWYKWQRQMVRNEILNGSYNIKCDVDIYMLVDTSAVYKVGSGTLEHNCDGFVIDGCDGKLHFEQKPKSSYSLYSDYYWYEIGDMICIGTMKVLYYCFPKNAEDIAAKARLGTEEMWKICNKK